MREDSISIGGEAYPVKGLTPRQSFITDLEVYEAHQANDNNAKYAVCLKRIALSLQNAAAFLPDPKNPQGQIGSASMPVEKVTEWLESGVFSYAREFDEADAKVRELLGAPKPEKAPVQGAKETPGEQAAPE